MSPEMAEPELARSYRGPRLDRRHRRARLTCPSQLYYSLSFGKIFANAYIFNL
ncbi:hypothetical protein Peur_009844 [Populus x canadensis]